jgi:hypothetical protein
MDRNTAPPHPTEELPHPIIGYLISLAREDVLTHSRQRFKQFHGLPRQRHTMFSAPFHTAGRHSPYVA